MLQSLKKAVRGVIETSRVNTSDIACMCVDTTCCTVVALDEAGVALRPAILWMDMRSAEQADRISQLDDPALRVNNGGMGPVSAEWMVPKALWLKENEPAVYEQAAYIVEYQDYVNHYLTGRMCGSINNMTIRWHYDAERGWPESLLQSLGIFDLMQKWPKDVLKLGDIVGGLSEKASSELGLIQGMPVAQGGADAFVGMIGLGVIKPGQMALLTGSSHLHLGCTDRMFESPGVWGTYRNAVIDGVNIVEGGQTSTGSILAWLKRLLSEDYEVLNREAEGVAPGCDGVLSLDHFQGNRTPFTDPLSRGGITGLSLAHTRAHLYRSLIEAVCYGTECVLEAMRKGSYSPESIVVAGGPTKSELWLQCHADVSQIPFVLTKVSDAPCLGSAILAAVGANLFEDVSSAVKAMVHVERVVKPNPDMKSVYDSYLKQYKTLYHSLANSRQTVASRKRKMAASVKGVRPIISPSILSADFANLAQEVAAVYRAGSEWIHVDIFDGNFVPNLTIGPPVVKSLRKHTDAFLDCHLCVLNPQNYVDGMKFFYCPCCVLMEIEAFFKCPADMHKAGASQFTFHFETLGVDYDLQKARQLISKIKSTGMQVGIALTPETDAEMIFPLVHENILDTVLLLSVKPGFGGQKFMPSVLPKVEALRRCNSKINIEVDGGINLENAPLVAQAGANALVAGTTVFAGPKPVDEIVPELVTLISNGIERCTNFSM